MKTLLATLVFAVTATAALADSPLPDGASTPNLQGSSLSRAAVKAQVLQARAEGTLFVTTEGNPLNNVAVTSNKTRAEVQAEATKPFSGETGGVPNTFTLGS